MPKEQPSRRVASPSCKALMQLLLIPWLWLGQVKAGAVWEAAFALQPDPGSRDLTAREYFVAEMADPSSVAADLGWTLEEPFPITDHWLFSTARGGSSHHKRSAAALDRGVRRLYGSGLSRLARRAPLPVETIEEEFGIHDPIFPEQWYLYNPVEEGHDMNVAPVWRRNITGRGVTVAIVDDGLDYDHPDFSESFSAAGSWDYNLHQNLPKPLLSNDAHGTRCAGQVAAGVNNACGVGIAPGAKVAGIRILSGHLTESDEARALLHQYNVNDIYSCSWGPSDDGMTTEGPPLIVRRAELEAIEKGRNGKGSIYVVASGNGYPSGDNCNYDGYTNSIYSITIGAVDRHHMHPYYAEICSANMAVTYSSNYVDKISTSDRLDPLNPDVAKCTNSHSGTSAAAPIAAGVFALVLEQRPDLTWRDLQYLVRETAKQFDINSNNIDAISPTWQITADGHHYHNAFGYGLLDADLIVARAKTWDLVKPQTWYFLGARDEHITLGESNEVGVTFSAHEWEDANMDHIEHVRVRLTYEHENPGSLRFQLVSPAGVISDLADIRPRDLMYQRREGWEFMSVVHWGEKGEGHWKLRVLGNTQNHGVLESWQLKFFGQAKDTSKVKRYSEVWDQYEPSVTVVDDAVDSKDSVSTSESQTADTATSTTGSPEQSGDSAVSTEAGTATSAEAPTSTTKSSLSQASSTSSSVLSDEPNTTETPTPGPGAGSGDSSGDSDQGEETDDDNGDKEREPRHHSLFYYITVSLIGIGLIVLISAPIVLYRLRRQANSGAVRLASDNAPALFDDEFELDDFEDDAENSEFDVSDLGQRFNAAPRTAADETPVNTSDDSRRANQSADDDSNDTQGLLGRP